MADELKLKFGPLNRRQFYELVLTKLTTICSLLERKTKVVLLRNNDEGEMLTLLPRLCLTLFDWMNHISFHCYDKGRLEGYVRCSLEGLGSQQKRDLLTTATTSITNIIGLFMAVWYSAKIDGKDVTIWPNTQPIPVHTTPVRQQSFNALHIQTPPLIGAAKVVKQVVEPEEVHLELPAADKLFKNLTVSEFWNLFKSIKNDEEKQQFFAHKKLLPGLERAAPSARYVSFL